MSRDKLFKTPTYANAVRFQSNNGGKLIYEDMQWQVVKEAAKPLDEALGVQMAVDEHEGQIGHHKAHIARLNKLEKHMDHLEDKVGPFGVEVDHGGTRIASHQFPAIDKHDFEDHMRKGKYTLIHRDNMTTSYGKQIDPNGENLVINHVHDSGAVHHSITVHHQVPKDDVHATPAKPNY
jgi:hypothetical protein